jgi:cytochrome c nitrite reductase small subunit
MEPRRERWYRRLAGAILPPPQWQLAVIVAVGVLFGLGILLFHVSRASSYLSDAPETCINCHVMAPHYATWSKSAHREVATCNDCHVPHDNIFRHYAFKASDGLYHSTVFTLRIEPQVIRIREPGMKVVQENCVRCHIDNIHAVNLQRVKGNDLAHADGLRCWDCHRGTPHGEINSLSAVPYENVPLPGRAIPEWMRGWLDRSTTNPTTSD